MTHPEEPVLLSAHREGDHVKVVLVGELDPHSSPLLEAEIDEALSDHARNITLDLSQLAFIDSSGLRVLIKAHQALEARGGELILQSPNETALRLLEITDLLDVFTVEPA